MIKPYSKFYFFLLINIFIGRAFCQSHYSEDLISIKNEMENQEYKKSANKLNKISEKKLSKHDRALYNFLYAKLFGYDDEFDKAFAHFVTSKKLYTEIDSTDMAMDINLELYNLISAQENNPTSYSTYLNEYVSYAEKRGQPQRLALAYIALGNHNLDINKPQKSIINYKKAIKLLNEINNKKMASSLYTNLAGVYNELLHKPDSALFYLNKQLVDIKNYGDVQDLCYNYINQAGAYYYLKNYQKAIQYLKMADNLPLKEYRSTVNQDLNEFLYKNYDSLHDYTNAYKYLKISKTYADSLNNAEQNIAINDIQTKYQTKEKELENNLLKSEVKTSRIMIYAGIIALLAVIAIALLILKNSRRKEKIAKQDKLIEQQKFEKTLKEYELHSIDVMLEGQEKERQRIANDLHDNLGSMLATLKLNFENLKLRKIELREEENKLYERTDELIEEAYQKVRRIAHAKNAGVFASEGLIPAIKKLADKISIPGKLQFQVVAFGFNERMENTLEITIFRAVQELSTNIIKHSQATEATIHLTNHDENINIMIEDNGVGFDNSKADSADGMGLPNIKKKIAQLGGTLEIDSTPGKGTTIIIDIPVND